MKKAFIMISLSLGLCGQAFAQSAPKVVRETLRAYQTQDAQLLKSHVVGIFKTLITEDYFEKSDVQKHMDSIKSWDGTIKEIRYQSGDFAGLPMTTALAYYADRAGDPDKICAVALSSKDQKDWVLVGDGLVMESREEFDKFSPDITSATVAPQAVSTQNFSVEMANGETFDDVNEEKLKEAVARLDDENFFMILTSDDNFIQAAYSDQGYDLQYKEGQTQYVARDYLTEEKAVEAFISYFQGDGTWKNFTPWDEM